MNEVTYFNTEEKECDFNPKGLIIGTAKGFTAYNTHEESLSYVFIQPCPGLGQ